MTTIYNEAYWETLDSLITSTSIVIDRETGSAHPDYENMIYPLDYGYLAGTTSADGGGIDVFIGNGGEKSVVAIVCTFDLVKRDSEVKILLGCSETEMRQVVDFLTDGDGMQCLLVKRESGNS